MRDGILCVCNFTVHPRRHGDGGSNSSHREEETTDNVFPADMVVKSPEIQVYSSRREFRAVTTHTYVRARTEHVRARHSRAKGLPEELSRAHAAARHTSVVSHGGNLNEIRSVEEAARGSDSASHRAIRSGRKVKPLRRLPSIERARAISRQREVIRLHDRVNDKVPSLSGFSHVYSPSRRRITHVTTHTTT